MKCNSCGAEINSVIVNFFDHEGADCYLPFALADFGDETYGLELNTNWTGYGLDEADQQETIWCPHCKKFPFKSKEINTEEVIHVTCWN